MTDFKGKNVALIVSRFYSELSEKLVEGATKKYIELGGDLRNLHQFDVPGSFEIPQVAQKLVSLNNYDAIICLGIVIRGDTPHFEYVCDNVTRGIGVIARNADIPVIFGVLTTNNRKQVEERLGGVKGHKGEEAMTAALKMIETLKMIQNES